MREFKFLNNKGYKQRSIKYVHYTNRRRKKSIAIFEFVPKNESRNIWTNPPKTFNGGINRFLDNIRAEGLVEIRYIYILKRRPNSETIIHERTPQSQLPRIGINDYVEISYYEI